MIISHRWKFIFIKTGKTGGTSLEMALSKFLGPQDIVTPLSSVDEKKRQQLGHTGKQNFRKPLKEYSLEDFARLLIRGIRAKKYWNHIRAKDVRERIGQSIWDNYYKFTVERKPWDKAVSTFYWHKKGEVGEQSLKSDFRKHIQSGGCYDSVHFDSYCIDGIQSMDKVALYHKLDEDLGEISRALGLPENVADVMKEIKAKGQYRPKKSDYRELFDEETKALVDTMFAREIKLFNFEY